MTLEELHMALRAEYTEWTFTLYSAQVNYFDSPSSIPLVVRARHESDGRLWVNSIMYPPYDPVTLEAFVAWVGAGLQEQA